MAQRSTISGSVIDENGAPLAGANVILEDLILGASTDLNGQYSIVVPRRAVRGQPVLLQTEYVGYKRQERSIPLSGGAQTQDFQLERDLLKLNEVVVTGVAEATPTRKLAFSVSTLDESMLLEAPGSSAIESMQGKIAGASIIRNSGAPGEAYSVRLRGSTRITGNVSPLFIVDGVILGADNVDIDALDLESVEIAKGAAASSLYGARAQNGVVNIRTRRGTSLSLNQTRITIRNEFGFNDLAKKRVANRSHNFRQNEASQFLDATGNIIPYGRGLQEDVACHGMALSADVCPGETYDPVEAGLEPG
jgi:TonB-dependent SusC/RagA subfamily outer membrane receptor